MNNKFRSVQNFGQTELQPAIANAQPSRDCTQQMRPISNAASWLVLAGVTVLLSAASAGPSAARSIPPGGRPLGAAARGVGPRLHFVGPGRIRETVEALFRNSPSIHEHADAAGDLADDAAAGPSPTCRRSYIGNTVRLLAARPATTVPTSHLSRTTTLFASLGTIATRGGAKGGPGDVSGTGFWPPWPFNLMRKPGTSSGWVGDGKNGDVGDASNGSIQYTKSTGVFWTYAAHRAKVWARQCQQSELMRWNVEFIICLTYGPDLSVSDLRTYG